VHKRIAKERKLRFTEIFATVKISAVKKSIKKAERLKTIDSKNLKNEKIHWFYKKRILSYL
jgi:hypothetical protein